MAAFGYNIGIAFQIQDDLLDIFADEQALGKRVGSDLAMNKKTIATIRLRIADKTFDFRKSDMMEFREALQKHGIVGQIETLAGTYFNEAKTCFARISPNEYTEYLNVLSEYLIKRDR
jgi:geranylgeranyl diphosphate synthase type II